MEKVTLNVEGMSCSHCEHAVKTAVGAMEGVASVDVNLAEKTVTIEYEADKVSQNDLKSAIEEEGYDIA